MAYARGNVVSIIDTVSQRVVANVPVGESPQEIVLTRDGGRAYVTNPGSGTISVLDPAAKPEP